MVGDVVLNPRNIGWLQSGDLAQSYLGWRFFSQDSWAMPLGLNPNYGLELSSSIVYSDSIPWLAILFKIAKPILPEPFQYFGIWMLMCMLLQGLISWKLLGLTSANPFQKLIGTIFFIMSPILLFRVGMHPALMGHFLVVGALYLSLSDKKSESTYFVWLFMLIAAAGVHFYIFTMVLVLGIAKYLDVLRNENRFPVVREFIQFILLVLILVMIFWILGYFIGGGDTADDGYGLFRMDLLSIFNSRGWSYVLSPIPESNKPLPNSVFKLSDGTYEGFNYLGLGIMCLVFAMLFRAKSFISNLKDAIKTHYFLFFFIIGMSLFSISNHITLGKIAIHLPLPESLIQIASILRSSGRMFWPSFYLLYFIIIWGVVKIYSRKVALVILSISAFIQFYDLSPGWGVNKSVINKVESSSFKERFVDPFWNELAKNYTQIKWLPSANTGSTETDISWAEVSYFAGTHQLGTDAVSLARMNKSKLTTYNQNALNDLALQRLSANIFYIVDEENLPEAIVSINSSNDLLAKVDGIYVLAPNWLKCKECEHKFDPPFINKRYPILSTGEIFLFGRNGKGVEFLMNVGVQDRVNFGWSYPEEWGVWSSGDAAKLVLPIPAMEVESLNLKIKPYLPNIKFHQEVEVYVNGRLERVLNISKLAEINLSLPVPKGLKFIKIAFKFKNSLSPMDVDPNSTDYRKLSIALISGYFSDKKLMSISSK